MAYEHAVEIKPVQTAARVRALGHTGLLKLFEFHVNENRRNGPNRPRPTIQRKFFKNQ